MSQQIPDGHEWLRAMQDRLHAELSDEPRIDFSHLDEMAIRIEKSQARQRQVAKFVWTLGILILVVSTIAGWMQWYLTILAIFAWMVSWTFISNQAIRTLTEFRKRQAIELAVATDGAPILMANPLSVSLL